MDAAKLNETYKPLRNPGDILAEGTAVHPVTLQFSDCALPEFMEIAAGFGSDTFAFVVTPNVDHLIRYYDDVSFRELYRAATFVLLDSRFLARLLRLISGVSLPTSPGSDVTAQLFDEVSSSKHPSGGGRRPTAASD